MAEQFDPMADAIVWEPPVAEVATPPEPPPPPVPADEPPDEPAEAEPTGEEPVRAPGEGEEPVAGETPPPESRFQRRFSDLTHERDLAKQRAELLERENEYLRQRVQEPLRQEPPAAPPPEVFERDSTGMPVYPSEERYATTQDYHQALHAYHTALTQVQIQQALTAERQRIAQEAGLQHIRAQYPDYDAVMQRSIRVSTDVLAVLGSLGDERAAVEYHILKNADTLGPQMASLHGSAALWAIADIRAEVRQARAAAVPTGLTPPPVPSPSISQAPPPVTRLRTNGVPPPRSYDEMNEDEFFAVRQKEAREARRW